MMDSEATGVPHEEEMADEYDLARMKRVDTKAFFERLFRERGGRMLDPKLAEQFPDSHSLNEALYEYLRLKAQSTRLSA